MMSSSLEKALKETWEKKEKFYEDTKGLSIREILERIEGKKFIQSSSNKKHFSAMKIKTKGFKFNRDEANEQ